MRTVHLRITPKFKLRLALLLAAIVAVQVLVYILGRHHAIDGFSKHQMKQRDLVHELNQKTIAFKGLQAELVRVEKSAEVDRLAAEQVRQELFGLRTQLADLQRDVEFYKGLVAPEELNKGLKLHEFALVEDATRKRYDFKLVLANIGGKNRVVKGELKMILTVQRQGETEEVAFTELPGYEGANPLKLRFRFFQNINGSFKLPEDWQPASVEVAANVKDASGQLFSVSYNWQELLRNSFIGSSNVR